MMRGSCHFPWHVETVRRNVANNNYHSAALCLWWCAGLLTRSFALKYTSPDGSNQNQMVTISSIYAYLSIKAHGEVEEEEG